MSFMPDHPKIYLASSSPRRNTLMQMGGWKFSVLPANIDEAFLPAEIPSAYVLRIAVAKAKAVGDLLKTHPSFYSQEPGGNLLSVGSKESDSNQSTNFILAADTIVVDGKEILGKPRDEAEAVCMLTRLRSRIHQVFTGLALVSVEIGTEKILSGVEEGSLTIRTNRCMTEVVMRNYHDDEITNYVASGDALDKAGSYAIQNGSFNPVKCIRGCYTNVMGLPLCHVAQLFRDIGVLPHCRKSKYFPLAGKLLQRNSWMSRVAVKSGPTRAVKHPRSLHLCLSLSNKNH